jgi:putative DNA primase/helicase
MRQDFFEYTPQFKLTLSGNHKPALKGVDEAIRRRFLLLPFTVTVPKEMRDPDLVEKLKSEWSGILQWAIKGCLEWQKIELSEPEAVLGATTAYLESEDAFQLWLSDSTVRDPNGWESTAELFRSWSDWARAAGEEIGPQKQLAQSLETAGFKSAKNAERSKRGFKGLRLRLTDYTSDPRLGEREQ